MSDSAAADTAKETPSTRSAGWAVVAHLGIVLLGVFPLTNLLVPFAIWYRFRRRCEFLRRHCLEAINLGITWTPVYIALLFLPQYGHALAEILEIVLIVLAIVAVFRAARGKEHSYPATYRALR